MTMSFNCPEPDLEGHARPDEIVIGATYQTLLYTVFQKPRERETGGVVVALTSCNRGEGVTYVTRQLAHELGRRDTSVACVNVNFLRRLYEPTLEAIRNTLSRSANKSSADSRDSGTGGGSLVKTERRGPWEGSWQYRRECIELLRSEFQHTIIDCPTLAHSGDLLSVAPFVDGVILVVEANRTRREQPKQAEQAITAAGGQLLGYILNKRTYEVPHWLYSRL
jgi:Mrp family chromosome partitioning ATPase